MEDMLSQAEIDALLNGSSSEGNEENSAMRSLRHRKLMHWVK